MRSAAKEMSMAHSAAMVQRLLMRIESLEHQVHLSSVDVFLALTPIQLNQAYQSFQGLEQHVTASRLAKDRLYKFMHKHGQWMEDIEAHLGVLHNLFMEVNDCLNDLDTGHCRCRDVLSTPVLDEPLVSPSISAVGGGEEVVPLMMTVDEEEVPLPLRVHGQRAWRSRSF